MNKSHSLSLETQTDTQADSAQLQGSQIKEKTVKRHLEYKVIQFNMQVMYKLKSLS